MTEYKIVRKYGREIEAVLIDFAQLRITVFAEFPYLYEGNLNYEIGYIQTYLDAPNSFFLGIYYNDQLIGATTCIPLSNETPAIREPFLDQAIDINTVFYFGESILLKEHRGKGFGHLFFDEREKHAAQFEEIQFTAFCAVERAENHYLKPKNYRSNEAFWTSRKYEKQSNLTCQMAWLDRDATEETSKKLTFWIKKIIP